MDWWVHQNQNHDFLYYLLLCIVSLVLYVHTVFSIRIRAYSQMFTLQFWMHRHDTIIRFFASLPLWLFESQGHHILMDFNCILCSLGFCQWTLECTINSCQIEENWKWDSNCIDFLGCSLSGCFIKLKQNLKAFTDAVKKPYWLSRQPERTLKTEHGMEIRKSHHRPRRGRLSSRQVDHRKAIDK